MKSGANPSHRRYRHECARRLHMDSACVGGGDPDGSGDTYDCGLRFCYPVSQPRSEFCSSRVFSRVRGLCHSSGSGPNPPWLPCSRLALSGVGSFAAAFAVACCMGDVRGFEFLAVARSDPAQSLIASLSISPA